MSHEPFRSSYQQLEDREEPIACEQANLMGIRSLVTSHYFRRSGTDLRTLTSARRRDAFDSLHCHEDLFRHSSNIQRSHKHPRPSFQLISLNPTP